MNVVCRGLCRRPTAGSGVRTSGLGRYDLGWRRCRSCDRFWLWPDLRCTPSHCPCCGRRLTVKARPRPQAARHIAAQKQARAELRALLNAERTCRRCGKPIPPTRRTSAVYCSPACYRAHHSAACAARMQQRRRREAMKESAA